MWSATLAAGEQAIVSDIPAFGVPVVAVVANPAGGASGTVAHTISPDPSDGSALWLDWPSGAVNTTTYDVIQDPITGLRLSASGGSVAFEVAV